MPTSRSTRRSPTRAATTCSASLASLTPLLREHRSATWDGWKPRGRGLQEGVAQHRRIFEALQQRDVEAAIAAMSDHLDQASSSIVAHVGRQAASTEH